MLEIATQTVPVVVDPAPLADVWHAFLNFVTMWLAFKFHAWTGGRI